MKDAQAGLQAMGIDKDCFRIVALLPLVSVAWADGRVQRAERAVILRLARDKGWLAGGGEALLHAWLDEPPDSDYVEQGLQVLRALADSDRGLGKSIAAQTLPELLGLCRDVAAAAGGAWGFAEAISPEEEASLADIARALQIEDGATWRDIVQSTPRDDRSPPSPKRHVLMGHVLDFAQNPLESLPALVRGHGDLVSLDLIKQQAVLVAHPDHVQHIFADNARNYKRGVAWDAFSRAFGASMLSRNGEPWRRVRRIAQPTFHKRKLAVYADAICRNTSAQLDTWQRNADDGRPILLTEEMYAITLRVVGHILFGIDLLEVGGVREAMAVGAGHFARLMLSPFPFPEGMPTAHNREFKRAKKLFDDLLYGEIDRHRAGEAGDDLLAMLIAATYEDTGEHLTDEELRNELLAFFVAGFETTAMGLTYVLTLLSRHAAVLKRLEAEVEEVLGGRSPGVADMRNMPYTRAVIDESLRLYPPVWFMTRDAIAEDWIGGCRIAAGTMTLTSAYVTGRHPEFWPNPEAFDPERFLGDRATGRHKYAYFPFGAGQHRCVGMNLALMEMQLVVPLVVQRYRLELLAGFQMRYDTQLTLRPSEDVPMMVRARSQEGG